MASSWREIERVRHDRDAMHAIARRLQNYSDLTLWEEGFLASIARLKVEEFSTRQAEKLLQIRDDYELIDAVRGFSVSSLLRDCYLARADLTEDEEEWLVALWQRGAAKIRRREAHRLLKFAERLFIIEVLS